MAIVQTVNFSSFCDAFVRMDRTNNFSYEAKQALFDYLENMSEETGEDFELDIIALCCEYSEASASEIIESFDLHEIEDFEDEEDFKERQFEEVKDYLEYNTFVVMAEDGKFVYANF